jgi:uncharacterized damage-inducible protein DinB
MHPFFEDYLDNLQELHADLRSAVAGLPPAALDWTPGPSCNSFGQIITHIAGAERFWIGDVVAGRASGRDRDAEFQVRQVELEDLLQKLTDSLEYTRRLLESMSPEDLGASRLSSRKKSKVTVAWALNHTLKHTAQHLGHLQLSRQLWEMSGLT